MTSDAIETYRVSTWDPEEQCFTSTAAERGLTLAKMHATYRGLVQCGAWDRDSVLIEHENPPGSAVLELLNLLPPVPAEPEPRSRRRRRSTE